MDSYIDEYMLKKKYKKYLSVIGIITLVILILLIIINIILNIRKDDIKIIVPSSSKNKFNYSQTEILTKKDNIKITSREGMTDCEIILKPVDSKNKGLEKIEYITNGMPLKVEVKKDTKYKIGINMVNDTANNIEAHLIIEGADYIIENEDKNESK